MSLGGVAWSQEDHSKGRGYFEAALAIQRKLSNLAGVAGALHNLGLEEQYQGHFAVAHAYMEECIQINRQIGNYPGLSLALNSLGTLHQELGEYATARAGLEESLAIARSMRDKDRMAMVLNNLGNVALSEGNLAEAKTHYDESLDLALDVEARISTAFAYFGLGMFALLQQDDATAHRQMSQALVTWHEFKMKRVILRVLDCMALYFSRQGQPEKALALLGFAEVLREQHLLPPRAPAFLPFYKQAVANARGRLTPAQFVAAWQQGRDLTLEQAVTLALL
jgi:tetratricopeptide (TPR) repeat protein